MKINRKRLWFVLVLLVVLSMFVGWGGAKAQVGPPEYPPAQITFYLFYDDNGSGVVDSGDTPARNYSGDLYVEDQDASYLMDADTNSDGYVQVRLLNCPCNWTYSHEGMRITSGTSGLNDPALLILAIVGRDIFLPIVTK